MQRISVDGLDMYWYHSEADGTLVLAIETTLEEDENGPKIRVYLNDEAVFENPRYPNDVGCDPIGISE